MSGSARRVVVVGGGAAGVAAAFAASRAGARVTLVSAGAGATSFGGGAVDDVPWDRAPASASELRADLAAFVAELGAWHVGERRALVATGAGVLRSARGRDLGVLDLAPLEGASVGLPRVDHAGFDADALARGLGDEPRARGLGLRFEAVDADVLRFAHERLASDVDLAAAHDDDARLAWLAERLAPVAKGRRALLVGPWLGLARARAAELSAMLGVAVGELAAVVDAPFGARFDAAAARLLDASSVDRRGARVASVEARTGEVRLASGEVLGCDAVVLATGGLIGGGLELSRAVEGGRAEAPFVAPLASGVALAAFGEPLDSISTPWGLALDEMGRDGRDVFAAVGLATLEDGRARGRDGRAVERLFVAGDARADRPRTLLEAVASGLVAGEAAAR